MAKLVTQKIFLKTSTALCGKCFFELQAMAYDQTSLPRIGRHRSWEIHAPIVSPATYTCHSFPTLSWAVTSFFSFTTNDPMRTKDFCPVCLMAKRMQPRPSFCLRLPIHQEVSGPYELPGVALLQRVDTTTEYSEKCREKFR